ncbi:hypothetical protein AAC387_Pa05g0613 [Persea americana]
MPAAKMGLLLLLFFFISLPCLTLSRLEQHHETIEGTKPNSRTVIDVGGGPDSVVWVVQLSDLHFSVFHPDRADDLKRVVGPSLALINPSLVLITGDLTDGKSKDLLIMKQDEEEWIEYQEVMEAVIEKSGLDKKIFYDLRGNHDKFGVPVVGGTFDFFHNYSINAGLGRTENVNSVTLAKSGWKHLFVGLDSAMGVGLRGPTNLFGHPTDQLLSDLDSELSQWDSQVSKRVTKIAFGHFPLSFSTATESGKNLRDVFLKHSLSAYLCGHLHTKFGKNIKRHHMSFDRSLISEYFQLNMFQGSNVGNGNCLNKTAPTSEFWEWEMGDWRKSRIMRILAIDRGHVSFVDVDFTFGAKRTIILPTFPLDSRFMLRTSSLNEYNCQLMDVSSYETIRALVFSESDIASVIVRIFDSSPGDLDLVMESTMRKNKESKSRGDLYTIPWNWRAFSDPSPNRFWMQIEATDFSGRSSFTELRPISINGLTAKINWRWKEFIVMGCQWDALYHPMFWSFLLILFSMLLVPKAFLVCSNEHYTYKNLNLAFNVKGIGTCLTVFTESGRMGYMTHMGWTVHVSDNSSTQSHIGLPDVIVVVMPHICFVVLPAVLVSAALAAEKAVYHVHYLSLSGKKEDDYKSRSKRHVRERWIRKLLFVISLMIFWKHWKNCRALTKAPRDHIFNRRWSAMFLKEQNLPACEINALVSIY